MKGNTGIQKIYFTISLRICGKLLDFRINTGADIYIINKSAMKKLSEPVKKVKFKKLVDAGGLELTYLGIIETVIKSNHKFADTRFYVVKQAPHNRLGISEIMVLRLLARVRKLRVDERHQQLCKWLQQFKIKLKE